MLVCRDLDLPDRLCTAFLMGYLLNGMFDSTELAIDMRKALHPGAKVFVEFLLSGESILKSERMPDR